LVVSQACLPFATAIPLFEGAGYLLFSIAPQLQFVGNWTHKYHFVVKMNAQLKSKLLSLAHSILLPNRMTALFRARF